MEPQKAPHTPFIQHIQVPRSLPFLLLFSSMHCIQDLYIRSAVSTPIKACICLPRLEERKHRSSTLMLQVCFHAVDYAVQGRNLSAKQRSQVVIGGGRKSQGDAHQVCKPFLLLAALLLQHEFHPVRQIGRGILALVMLYNRLHGALLALELQLLGFRGMVYQDLQDMDECSLLHLNLDTSLCGTSARSSSQEQKISSTLQTVFSDINSKVSLNFKLSIRGDQMGAGLEAQQLLI